MMSDHFADKISMMIWSNTISAYSAYYIAFYSDSVNSAGSGTDITGTVAGSRQVVTFSAGGTGEALIDAKTITVLNAATIQSIAIWDAVSAGNMVAFEDLPSPVSVVPGSWTIDAGDIKLLFT